MIHKLLLIISFLTLIPTSILAQNKPYPSTLWSSDKVPETIISLRAGSITEIGKKEVVAISAQKLNIFRFEGHRALKSFIKRATKNQEWIKVALVDLDKDGIHEILLSGFYNDRVEGQLISLKGGQFKLLDTVPYYLDKIIWNGQEIIAGQKGLGGDDFTGPLEVFEWNGSKLKKKKRIELPGGLSTRTIPIYSLMGLPSKESERFLALGESGQLKHYIKNVEKFRKSWQSGTSYGGSVFYLNKEIKNPFNQVTKNRFFIPIRLASNQDVFPWKEVYLAENSIQKNETQNSEKEENNEEKVKDEDNLPKVNLEELQKLIKTLNEQMESHASQKEYEEAAKLRDEIATLKEVERKYHIAEAQKKREAIKNKKRINSSDTDNLSIYLVKNEGYLKNVIGAVPSIKNTQMVRLVWSGYGFQEVWNSPRLEGAISDYDLVDWDGDGKEEILAAFLLREGGYVDTLKRQDSLFIVLDTE